jgi:hypothetical protein
MVGIPANQFLSLVGIPANQFVLGWHPCQPICPWLASLPTNFHGWHPCQPIVLVFPWLASLPTNLSMVGIPSNQFPWLASLPTNTMIAAKAGAARYHVPRNTRPYLQPKLKIRICPKRIYMINGIVVCDFNLLNNSILNI